MSTEVVRASPDAAPKAVVSSTLPLLRRPRPPSQVFQGPENTSSSSSGRKASSPQRGDPQKSVCTPHPTPYSCATTADKSTLLPQGRAYRTYYVHPLFPRGPSFFPPGRVLRQCGPVEESESQSAEEFTLDEFQFAAETSHPVLLNRLQGSVISRQNYLKLTGWFAANVPQQESINTVELTVEHNAPPQRKPFHQVLLELQRMVQAVVEAEEAARAHRGDVSPATLEDEEETAVLQPRPPGPNDIMYHGSLSRYFCGLPRSKSPFVEENLEQPVITPSEAAILECMMEGGCHLNLKAHFLSQLPDISPLQNSLTYLNLSYNNLSDFPTEVLYLKELICLSLRNNPISELPQDIRRLSRLMVLCISFNKLTVLPKGLCGLESLEELDLSHNTIEKLPRELANLRSLRRLNVEGNRLHGIPSSCLRLSLTHLQVADNYMHPVFWQESTSSNYQPQSLAGLCCIAVTKLVDSQLHSLKVQEILKRRRSCDVGACDCCAGPVFGGGYTLVRSMALEQCGAKNIPLVFTVCSQSCKHNLRLESGKQK